MDAVNTSGRYVGKTTKLSVTNTSESVLHLKVDLGMILKPADSAYQPLVLAGEEMLVVQPSKSGEVEVNTFCGNSLRHCPAKDLHYSFARISSDTLLKVLRFIKTNSLFDYLGQDAVWAITNGHGIDHVYNGSKDMLSESLIELVCKVTGRPKPEYYSVSDHVEMPSAAAYVPKTLKIIANFEIILESPKVLSLGVYDSAGKMIQPVFENQSFQRSGHRFGVEFESADVSAGNYYIWLKEGDKVLQQKMVKVD